MVQLIVEQQEIHTSLKINFELFCVHIKCVVVKNEEQIENSIKSFNTKNEIVTGDQIKIECLYDAFADTIKTQSEEFQERDSGWALEKILYLEVNICKYSSYIRLPEVIQNKKAVIYVKNEDDACFAWAVVSAMYPAQRDSCRTTSYPHYADTDISLNFKDINIYFTF